MTHLHSVSRLLALAAFTTTLAAQGGDLLLSFSQPEKTLSGSGGTVLQFLQPNEVAHIERTITPCTVSAEKWMTRTCAHTMAGDENADSDYWNPAIFGTIDALCDSLPTSPIASLANQRTVFWSVSAPMGNAISASPFRPGDVARIVRSTGGFEGQVEYFMKREHFNQVMGLPLATPIDVDAIAWSPNYGVFFSLDVDTPALLACGPALVRDGDLLCVPAWAITWTPDMRVGAVLANTAQVVITEAQFDAFVVAANVANRFGGCVPNAVDLESVEIDWSSTGSAIVGCPGSPLTVPDFLFTTETMTGASVLTTAGGGAIWSGMCMPAGRTCGFGPTMGPQMGIQSAGLIGAPSYVNSLCTTFTRTNVLEPQQHAQNLFPFGAPLGATVIDYNSPFNFNVALIEFITLPIPGSITVAPTFSPTCFPDLYAQSLITWWWPNFGQFGSFPMPPIPANYTGELLFQHVGFSWNFELSTPAIVDIN